MRQYTLPVITLFAALALAGCATKQKVSTFTELGADGKPVTIEIIKTGSNKPATLWRETNPKGGQTDIVID